MDDPVNHPAHYTQYKHEVIELTEHLSFCLGNAVKYILRAPFKGSEIQDYEKALWYMKRLREQAVFELPSLDYDLITSFDNPIVSTLLIEGFSHYGERFDRAESMIKDAILEAQKKEIEHLKQKLRNTPHVKEIPDPWKPFTYELSKRGILDCPPITAGGTC